MSVIILGLGSNLGNKKSNLINAKILLNTRDNYKNLLEKDIKALETDYLFKKSCGETELLPFIS